MTFLIDEASLTYVQQTFHFFLYEDASIAAKGMQEVV